MTIDLANTSAQEGVSVLSWLHSVAEQSQPSTDEAPAVIPVAWMGRTSTDDQQDPTLSLPRQLENCRAALPAQFVIVAKFYDIESGRNALDLRGHSDKHKQFNIPIARDGGIADLLSEATRPDRRFVAVICESIERVARVSYFSTKIEYELGAAGVALLAADEGVDPARVLPAAGGRRPKQATQILTRRVKQAISEWYVINMLEMSWDGAREHTRQGWNIGKPPYGYLAERHPHPVKAKRDDGKVKTRLVPDPDRGPVVTQIFQWRALECLGSQDIVQRLNADLKSFPPPQPIPGKGRRAVGAWTKTAVLELLANPKYTGYMVWNRRRRPRPDRQITGRMNPPNEWVWSLQPTHEPLVTKALFDAATPIGRLRRGSRLAPGPNIHPDTERSYVLRSYVICEICGRRMCGRMSSGTRRRAYYACVVNQAQHQEKSWFAEHPTTVALREHMILPFLGKFFANHVLSPSRLEHLESDAAAPHLDDGELTTLRARLATLDRAQQNLLTQLETNEPTGDEQIDAEWRTSLQKRFAANSRQRRDIAARIAELASRPTPKPATNGDKAALLQALPITGDDLTQLPDDVQRHLYDAFHLQIRYHRTHRKITIQVKISASTVGALTDSIAAATTNRISPTEDRQPQGASVHAVRTPNGIRTRATALKDRRSTCPTPSSARHGSRLPVSTVSAGSGGRWFVPRTAPRIGWTGSGDDFAEAQIDETDRSTARSPSPGERDRNFNAPGSLFQSHKPAQITVPDADHGSGLCARREFNAYRADV